MIVRYLIILRWINRKWKKSAKANVTQSLSAVYRSLSLPTKWGCNNKPKCSFWLSVLPDLYLIRGNQMDLTAKRSDKEMSGNSKTANRGVFIWCHGLALCNSEALGSVAPFWIWLTKTLTFNEPETKQHWKWYEYLMQGQAAIFYVQQFIRMFHGCQIWIITKNKQILITNKNRKSLLRCHNNSLPSSIQKALCWGVWLCLCNCNCARCRTWLNSSFWWRQQCDD